MSGIDAVFKSQLRPLDTDGPEEKGALVKNPSGGQAFLHKSGRKSQQFCSHC